MSKVVYGGEYIKGFVKCVRWDAWLKGWRIDFETVCGDEYELYTESDQVKNLAWKYYDSQSVADVMKGETKWINTYLRNGEYVDVVKANIIDMM